MDPMLKEALDLLTTAQSRFETQADPRNRQTAKAWDTRLNRLLLDARDAVEAEPAEVQWGLRVIATGVEVEMPSEAIARGLTGEGLVLIRRTLSSWHEVLGSIAACPVVSYAMIPYDPRHDEAVRWRCTLPISHDGEHYDSVRDIKWPDNLRSNRP